MVYLYHTYGLYQQLRFLGSKNFLLSKKPVFMRVSGVFFSGLYLTITPAAARTIGGVLEDLGLEASAFDGIFTGDLGYTGTRLLYQLMEEEYGRDIRSVHNDCGLMIFDLKAQDVHSGGSGCGCGASVLCSHILKQMRAGKLKNVLFVATGALMSPTSCKQGHPIPSIAHAIWLQA